MRLFPLFLLLLRSLLDSRIAIITFRFLKVSIQNLDGVVAGLRRREK